MAKRKKGMTFIPYDYEAAYNKSLEDMHEFFVEQIGDLMDNEIIGWEKHGTHRFPGSLGTQRSWKRIHPKKDGDGFINIDENTELPFE